jgi:hypothetical protein
VMEPGHARQGLTRERTEASGVTASGVIEGEEPGLIARPSPPSQADHSLSPMHVDGGFAGARNPPSSTATVARIKTA